MFELKLPAGPSGLVICAGNPDIARALYAAGFATVLFELLKPSERNVPSKFFDIDLMASRFHEAIQWVQTQSDLSQLPLGLYGESTGASAALWAASEMRTKISAIVSRAGRPDLAVPRLRQVNAPTLLIVARMDEPLLGMNRIAMKYLSEARLETVPIHISELVAHSAARWFGRYLIRDFAAA